MFRLDSTLGDFSGMQWSRGNVSFIFNGEEARNDTLSLVVLDNDSKSYQRMKLMGAVRFLPCSVLYGPCQLSCLSSSVAEQEYCGFESHLMQVFFLEIRLPQTSCVVLHSSIYMYIP